MSRKLVVLFTLVVATALTLAACSGGNSTATAQTATAVETPPVDVAVARATVGSVQSALEISGTLAPRARVGVKPKWPGRLERIAVELGDRVTQGQVIATLDRGEVDAQVDAAVAAGAVARASLESAEAALANATSEHERAKSLFDAGALPRQRLEAAETSHRAALAQRELAKATVAQADAAIRRAREIQRDATLHAPVSGFIVERNYDAGAIPGDRPVVVVADIRELKLEAGVSELEAGRLRRGVPATVSVQARPGDTFAGELAALAPEVDPRNRHFRIEVRVANPDAVLLAGMYATARLVLDSADNVVLVPRESIVTRDGQRMALKVVGGTVTPVPVVEGLSDGRQVQIVSGLAAGDQVVADARRQLPADARVNPIDAGQTSRSR
jgi:RND family efflux transporter MFP subunit